MRKNGFTLVELMGVIVILAIIGLVIFPIVDKNVKKSKDKMYKAQLENIRMAGMNYFSDNFTLKPSEGNYAFKKLDELIQLNYIEDNIFDPRTGKAFEQNIYIQLFNDSGMLRYSVCPFEDGCVNH